MDNSKHHSFKHGFSKHPLFRVWAGMKARCYNKNNTSYKDYGGRGIDVCEDWLASSAKFINWSIDNGWEEGLHIDRIDNDGNYHPDNCRFVTPRENSLNTRANVMVNLPNFFGTITEVAEMMGIHKGMLYARLRLGWPIERVIFEPANISKGKSTKIDWNNVFDKRNTRHERVTWEE